MNTTRHALDRTERVPCQEIASDSRQSECERQARNQAYGNMPETLPQRLFAEPDPDQSGAPFKDVPLADNCRMVSSPNTFVFIS
jgi:hypothetical protein